MSQNHVLSTGGFHHFCTYFTRESTLFFVRTVLCAQADDVLVEELRDRSEVDERCADPPTAVGLVSLQCFVQLFSESNTILKIHVHLPVSCNNFLSHFSFI